VQRHGAEGQRAVGVVDDGDAVRCRGDQRGGGVEQQPVGGVDRDQVRRVDVRRALEDVEQLGGGDGDQTPGRPTGQETPVELIGQ
jgi:hypothetical protein